MQWAETCVGMAFALQPCMPQCRQKEEGGEDKNNVQLLLRLTAFTVTAIKRELYRKQNNDTNFQLRLTYIA